MSKRVAVVYLLSTRTLLRIAIARKKYWSGCSRCTAPLLDAERRLDSTLPLHHHNGIAQTSNARRVLLRQDADLTDRRRRDRVVEHLPLLRVPAALRRAVLRKFIDAVLHSAQIMSLTPSTHLTH